MRPWMRSWRGPGPMGLSRRHRGLRVAFDGDPTADCDTLSAGWPEGARADPRERLHGIPAAPARTADLLPGPQRAVRHPDRTGLEFEECPERQRRVRDPIPGVGVVPGAVPGRDGREPHAPGALDPGRRSG